MWRYLAAPALGFAMQWFHMPSTSGTPFEGMAYMALIMVGAMAAYWVGWR